MKKVLFLQIKGKSYGGVWHVNKLVGEELIKNNYDVHIVSIRDNQTDIVLEHDPRLIVKTINEQDLWETISLSEILKEAKKLHFLNATKMFLDKVKHKQGLNKDIKKLHKYIYDYNPDYIIASHYQLLDMIPKSYLNKVIHEQHTSFKDAKSHKATVKTFKKYNNKVKYLWLTKQTMIEAEKYGLKNNSYIYNAVRFKTEKIAPVTKNKKLITIARLSEQKRIDIMIDIIEDIFKAEKYKAWSLEIYGTGPLEEKLKKLTTNNKQIKFMGLTNNPQKELLTSSINLNTSPYEGFSLSILEANECGVPTIAFDFGESTEEEIINNKTGIIAKDNEDYKKQLQELMDNSEKLTKISKNAKQFSKNFQIESIIKEWLNLFSEVDKRKGE